ncbi:hypothetical protein H6P81_005177 [Aristolochia fimbriata]|uniref:Aquaporin TIP5-1 n=1 Tax=Aristolochia fimbriata TaxID=158543 RepID=A0AAV7ETW1_ARIFI|nr:hypothetical protein H6P81_005177 [Aristolochia fimbriata]
MTSSFRQSLTRTAFRSYLAEFISTFFFVFAAVGSAMAASKMARDASTEPSSLVAGALAQAFALSATIYSASNVSGGHVNPAVTFGLAVGGHIDVTSAVFYWISQLVGSTSACLLLRLLTAGQAVPTTGILTEMTGFGGAILEGIATFALVYTVYAARDPRGSGELVGPIVVGLVLGANVMAMGPFTGGSMNPARSFGPAVVSGDFKNHAVYWVGPLVGAGAAAVVYQNVVFLSSPPDHPQESSHGAVETLVL